MLAQQALRWVPTKLRAAHAYQDYIWIPKRKVQPLAESQVKEPKKKIDSRTARQPPKGKPKPT